MFLQNIDSTAMVIALPSISATLHIPLLQLNLIITVYLLSLAVFLPLSAWLADRLGPKNVFVGAVALYSLASSLCGLATSMPGLIACRVLQGFAAAMMMPVGRLLLLRSVPRADLVSAMVWYTVPPLIARLSGPLIGGAIVSVASWHWIFFVNIPFGVLGVVLAVLFVEDRTMDTQGARFDFAGFALLGLGLACLMGAVQTVGKGVVANWVPAASACAGALLLFAYVLRSRRQLDPIIDLGILRYRTLRTNVCGAAPFRIALAAVPFLLPLMLQLGFKLSPLQTGSIVAASAFGALCTRTVTRVLIRRFGFRHLLLGSAACAALFWASFSLFSQATPHALMFGLIFGSGLVSSLCMVLLNTLGFSEVPKERTSHATALTIMSQQLMSGSGVTLAAMLLGLFSWLNGGDGVQLHAEDFAYAFVAVAAIALLSLLAFRKLDANEGAELR